MDQTSPIAFGGTSKWRQEIDACVAHRKTLLEDWRLNVANRVQKPFAAGSITHDTVAVPEDWARTKQKTAQLAYKVPRITATAKQPKYRDAAPILQAVVNDKLHREIRAKVMLDECLADVVNASGLMASIVRINITTETVKVPEQDISGLPPEQQAQMLAAKQVKEVPVENPIYECYEWPRISPANLLWPAEFNRSDWDTSPWLGHETWMHLVEAKKTFKKLPPDFKAVSSKPELLSDGLVDEASRRPSADYVKVQEIFYKAYLYDETSKHPEHLRRIVFVEGFEDGPVIHEDLTWQKYVPAEFVEAKIDPATGAVLEPPTEIPAHYIGVRKFPIRVATLTYVSDMATPPSDSQAGRAQVRELIKSRSQMLRQRDRAIPLRGVDTNRIDKDIIAKMNNGEWMNIIPVNGPGDRAIWEVARANYPRENFGFQTVIGGDLDRSWSMSNNASSQSGDERSATEAKIIQSAANIRLQYEKDRVGDYVVGGAEVLVGLMQIFTNRTDYVETVGPGGAKRMEAWDQETVNIDAAFDFVPDSADRVDPEVLIERTLKLYNLAANDPTINREALTRQLVEAYGMDPAVVMKEAPPPKDEPPNISYRFSGEDLLNPMATAVFLKANPDLGPDQIAAAAKMIQDAMRMIQTPQQPGVPGGGAPPVPPQQPDVEPPQTQEPILKRLNDGSRMAA